MTERERAESLTRVLAAIAASHGEAEDGVSRFLSLWHRGVPANQLRRENMLRFLSAHFLYAELHELDDLHRAELEAMLRAVEAATGVAFLDGDTPAVSAMRVSMPAEPLRWVHFPLGVYVGLAAVHAAAHVAMLLAGFRRYRIGVISYYYRAAATTAQLPPLVLLPGIGIGVAGYVPLLRALCADGAAAFVVELPHVAAGRLDGVVPDEDAVVASLLLMLRRHAPGPAQPGPGPAQQQPVARFVAHSYGSFVMAWVMRHAEARNAVLNLVLLDPVAVLIAFPHTLHGAVYRGPLEAPLATLVADAAAGAVAAATDAAVGRAAAPARARAAMTQFGARARLALSYVVTKEAHISLSVQRHTFWPSASLWLEDVPPECAVTLALSSEDVLLPVREVMQYAAAVAARRGDSLQLEVLCMAQHQHGEVALNPTHWPRLVAALAPRSSAAAPPHGE
jgi:hypothetical protein